MHEMDQLYETSFRIIANAGDARALALQAIKKSNAEEFEEADALLAEAKASLKNAHKTQTGLIQQEAEGKPVDVNIILIHSQDHFSMAMSAIDLAEQAIWINRKIKSLRDFV